MDYLLIVLLFYGYVLKTGGQVFLTGNHLMCVKFAD